MTLTEMFDEFDLWSLSVLTWNESGDESVSDNFITVVIYIYIYIIRKSLMLIHRYVKVNMKLPVSVSIFFND